MSDNTNFGFAKLVPGFDFLQNLAKGASSMPQMPTLSSWVAPTLNVEELEKRISDLKAVHFWLDQNSKALGATIQALEVQRMTLATLQGMNVSMGEVANALKLKTTESMSDSMQKMAGAAGTMAGNMATGGGGRRKAAEEPAKEPPAEKKAKAGNGGAGAPAVDPLQWWSSLTNQFQEIAANAMKDVAQTAAAMEPAGKGKASAAAKAPAKAARKTAARKRPPRKAA